MSNKLDHHTPAYEGHSKYDFDNNILLNWYSNRIIESSEPRQSILELGLGHGFTSINFSKHFKKHVVLDGSPEVIQNFKCNNPNFKSKIIETYFESFSTDEKYDIIVAGFVLEHVDDPVLVIKHFKKFLAPHGRMFISVPNAESMNRRLGHLSGLLPDMLELTDHDNLLGHQRYYTVSTLEKDICQAGSEVVNMEGIYLKPLTTSQLIDLQLSENIIKSLCLLGIDYPELSCGLLAEIK